MRQALLTALLGLGCASLGWAQAVQVSAHVEKARVGLGETIVLTEDVTYSAADRVQLPAAESLLFPPFEVRDAVATSLPGGQGTRYTVRLAAYENGPQTIPALSIPYGDGQTASSRPVSIEVARAVQQPAQEIHDLKPLPALATPVWIQALGFAPIALVLGLAAAALVKLIRRRRAAAGTPRQQALAALKSLAAQDLPAQGRLKQHYERLSEILRTYLARRYQLPVLEHTSGEVVGMLEDESLATPVATVLYQADLVKFARLEVPCDQARDQIGAVRRIIERSTPVPCTS